jgi:hypothetical protein
MNRHLVLPLNVDTDDSEGHVLCHFLIIHGGSFGYKMFSMSVMTVLRRACQNAWTTTSFRATPRHAACANNNIIPLRL